MAGVQTTLALNDKLTGPLMKMIRAMDATIRVMEKMDASATQLDTKGLAKARKAITNASADLERLMVASKQADSSLAPLGSKFANLPPPVGRATSAVNNFFAAFAGATVAYLSIASLKQGFQTFANAADTYASTYARLSNINDGLQTQVQLQEKIYQAAQRSRSGYIDMANSVAKLGLLAEDAFKSNDEVIRFSELMGKAFTVSGASTFERQAGMYQLTQAMAAGKLQGDEFRSIMENAPLLAQAIADFTGKTKGQLKEMSAEGTITSDIIKAALFNAADDIEKKFKNMPLTFADAMTMFKNWSLRAFEPLLIRFNQFVNSDAFATMAEHAMFFVRVFIAGMDMVFDALEFFYRMVGAVGRFFKENWSWIAPILTIIGSVLAGIGVILLGLAAKWLVVKTATMLAAAAQWVYNTAMLSSPATWVLLTIIALIGFVAYATVRWGEQTAVVVGYIVGAIYWLGAVFYNIMMGIGNFAIMVAEFFVNAWNQAVFMVQMAWIAFNLFVRMVFDAIGNNALRVAEFFINTWNNAVHGVQMAFYYMQQGVLTIMSSVASGIVGAVNHALSAVSTLINGAISGINMLIGLINKIPGVDISEIDDVDLKASTAAVDKLNSIKANLAVPTKVGPVSLGSFNSAGNYMNSVNMPTAPQQISFDRLQYKNLGEAFGKGQETGYNLSLKVSEKLSKVADKVTSLVGWKDSAGLMGMLADTLGNSFDPSKAAPGAADSGKGGNPTGGKLDKIGKIDDEINIAEEDLKVFKELATIKSIQNFVTLTPTVQVKTGDIRNNVDVDQLVRRFEESMVNEIARSAEGAYA